MQVGGFYTNISFIDTCSVRLLCPQIWGYQKERKKSKKRKLQIAMMVLLDAVLVHRSTRFQFL